MIQHNNFISATQQTKSIPPLLFHTWKIPPQSAKEIQHQKFRTSTFQITNELRICYMVIQQNDLHKRNEM
jgi:hypothetical protein